MSNELEQLRQKIDKMDERIFDLLQERFDLVKKIGEYKKANNLPFRNKSREQEIVSGRIKSCKLDAAFVRGFYKLVFNNSYKIEK